MKALVQSVRFFVFVIIDTLIAKHRDGVAFDFFPAMFSDFFQL
jgi:hypothetical protein